MKIRHQYLVIVTAALLCVSFLLWMGRASFIDAVDENHNLVQDQFDPLIRQQFPLLEHEHERIEVLLKSENELSNAFYIALRFYDDHNNNDLDSVATSMKSNLVEAGKYLTEMSQLETGELRTQIGKLTELHKDFENLLDRMYVVSVTIADELRTREEWRTLSEERFDPFRQTLDRLGEQINEALEDAPVDAQSRLEQSLSLVLNADRDCYQCFLSEFRVSVNTKPGEFVKWLSFHRENTQQIDERLHRVKTLGRDLETVDWDDILTKKTDWMEATNEVVVISERVNQYIIEKNLLLELSEGKYGELKAELNQTITLLEVRIAEIRKQFENTRNEVLASMNGLQEKSQHFVWLFNGFIALLLIFVVILLWFPRRIIRQISFVSEYLNHLTDDRLHEPFAMPDSITPHEKSEMDLLSQSINRMRANLVTAMEEQQKMIDKLREAKLQAQAAGAAKDEFLSVMSHELRTPLNPIVGFSDYLKSEVNDPKTIEFLDIIDESAKRLTRLIDNILDYTRFHKQIMDCEFEFFDYRELIRRCCDAENLRTHQEHVGLKTVFSHLDFPCLSPEILLIETDRKMLKQVVMILLSNAFKFTEQGLITVTVDLAYISERLGSLKIRVKDTGIGIPEEKRKNLFEPFFLVDGSTTRRYEGAGLSLAICDLVVRKLGGKVGCESELGMGSEFWFEIPVALFAPEKSSRRRAVSAAAIR